MLILFRLQCVQRLTATLRKQFDKRPEDKYKFETFNIDHVDQLNCVEQFFLKLSRLPNYNFKLKCYQYRDDLQSQLILLRQSIDQFLHGIELVLHHQYLPWIFQLLCFLYNLVSNRCVPGLDLISLGDALNSPTNQCHKTVAHVLVQILEEYYPEYLTHIVHDNSLTELKKIASVRYEKIYADVRDIYRQYQQLEHEYCCLVDSRHTLPVFISSMLEESKLQFEEIFQQENLIRKGEEDLATYFCSNNLSLDICLSTVGHFIDKLRLANADNHRSKTHHQ
jgi:hypothetical protein